MRAPVFAALQSSMICGDFLLINQPVTPSTSVSRDWSAQRVGGANATGLLLDVTDQHGFFSFPVSYNGGSEHKERTASR